MKTPTFSASDTLRGRGMGVEVDCPLRCPMCEAHEVREQWDREKLDRAARLTATLAEQAHADRRHAKAMRHQRNLALFALGLVFLIAGIRAVWK